MICQLSVKLKKKCFWGIILLYLKLLYDLSVGEKYLFSIYLNNYKVKLRKRIFPYDICFFIIKNISKNFGMEKVLINSTFNIKTKTFIKKENIEIVEAKFKTKIQTSLKISLLRNSNSQHIIIKAKSI